jgi:hypothetical protein
MVDLNPILSLLERFRTISASYRDILTETLGRALSSAALAALTTRISATVDRCGVTQIANDFIDGVLQQKNLRYELFARFLGTERFQEGSAKLRKILSYLFKNASRAEALKFQDLFEGTLMRTEIARLNFVPQTDECGVIEPSWATELVMAVVRLYETAQSVAQMELVSVPHCHLAAERALRQTFAELPSSSIAAFANALALVLDTLLRAQQEDELLPKQREAALQSVLRVQKVITTMFALMWVPLIEGN